MRTRDGRNVETSWANIRLNDGTRISIGIDISGRKLAEQAMQLARSNAERASAAKDQFLAVLSHELRTPLTPVLAAVQLLQREPALSDDVRQTVHMIRRNVELEARLIDDLLDLTRISRGKLQVRARAGRGASEAAIRRADLQVGRAGEGAEPGDATRRVAARRHRRPRAAAAGLLEPPEERDQVHARRRDHPRPDQQPAAGRAGRQRLRHRCRHRAGTAPAAVQRVRAGREGRDAQLRRPGPRAGDQQEPDRRCTAGRSPPPARAEAAARRSR